MSEWLLNMLGVRGEQATRVVDAVVALRGGIHPGWILLAAVLLGAGVVWLYRSGGAAVSARRRYVLAGLRVALLVMILGILLRPVLALTVEGSIRRTVVVLVDGSASMKIEDPRSDDADVKRVAIARGLLPADKGLEGATLDETTKSELRHVARVDVVKAALRNAKLDLLPRLAGEYDLRAMTFGQDVKELGTGAGGGTPTGAAESSSKEAAYPWIESLDGVDPRTAGGDAIRAVLARTRGQPLAGIVLVTDGAFNAGGRGLAAAQVARSEGIPLYIWGVGIGSPKDIIVSNTFAPEVAFLKDEVPVTVRVRGQGMAGQSARLVLKLGEQQVDEKTVQFDGHEQVVQMKLTPPQQGEFDLSARIEPLGDEVVKDNNQASQRLRVVDGKIKVLYVEQSPRWEFRYLQAMLLRDRRVELKCVLLEGSSSIAQEKNSPYLASFPQTKEELFKFDLLVLGDVEVERLTAGQLQNVSEFVSRFGGGLLAIAGRKHNPQAYRRTVLEKMLPVDMDITRAAEKPESAWMNEASGVAAADKPLRLELTAAGKRSPMLRLSDKEQESASRWGQLPPIFWAAPVTRAKPAAEVLLVDADPLKASRFGKMPIMAIQQYGMGQVMYVGTDNTWRWRRNDGEERYVTLWGQIIQRLSLPHLLGAAKRTQLSADRRDYVSGDKVTVYARLYTETYEPVTAASVKGSYQSPGQSVADVMMRAMPDQPGMYQAEFVAAAAGQYQFWVDTDAKARLTFDVAEPKLELGETAMNQNLLMEMAQTSGGAFYREEDLHKLPDAIQLKSEHVRSSLEVELWSSPIYFVLMLGVVTAEWVLRKKAQLK